MSMFSYVEGIVPPDEEWKKMKTAYDACKAAGVTPPSDITSFFNGKDPDPSGVIIRLEKHESVGEYKADMRDGFTVDISRLPKTVKLIRFVNSY